MEEERICIWLRHHLNIQAASVTHRLLKQHSHCLPKGAKHCTPGGGVGWGGMVSPGDLEPGSLGESQVLQSPTCVVLAFLLFPHYASMSSSVKCGHLKEKRWLLQGHGEN